MCSFISSVFSDVFRVFVSLIFVSLIFISLILQSYISALLVLHMNTILFDISYLLYISCIIEFEPFSTFKLICSFFAFFCIIDFGNDFGILSALIILHMNTIMFDISSMLYISCIIEFDPFSALICSFFSFLTSFFRIFFVDFASFHFHFIIPLNCASTLI